MFFNKRKVNPLFELRENILNGKIQINETVGSNHVIALILDVGIKRNGYSLIIVADNSCSLYFLKGGGIIGAGEHKNVQYVCRIVLNKANELIKAPVENFNSEFPVNNNYNIHILTKTDKHELLGKSDRLSEDSNSNMLFSLCNNVITQLRLLDLRKNEPISDDEILINFIKEENYEAFEIALDELNNPNANFDDKSALMIATFTGKIDFIKKLKSKDADINYKDSTGLNSLMVACYKGKPELIDELINDDNIDSEDNSGQTPLMFACNAGKYDCVKALIARKANLNAKDKEGSTPIMFAAQYGHDSIIRYLLENGADKNIVGQNGLKAIDFATQNKHTSTVNLLQ